jgi:hypothetical protein
VRSRPGIGVALHPDAAGIAPANFDGGSRLLLAPTNEQLAPTLLPAQPYPALDLVAIDDIGAVSVAVLGQRTQLETGQSSPATASIGVFEQLSDTRLAAVPPTGTTLPKYPDIEPGPPAAVVIFSQPRRLADDAEYNRWYDHIHTRETLMLPGFSRARRFRLAPNHEQLVPYAPWPHQPYLTIYDIDNVHVIPAARAAMLWFKDVSAQFASPALDVPPACWTYVAEQPRNRRPPPE